MRVRRFVDVGAVQFVDQQFVERNAELREQFAPARAARGEINP
jgi:hypothetical protein